MSMPAADPDSADVEDVPLPPDTSVSFTINNKLDELLVYISSDLVYGTWGLKP